jgi:hypothetical protein
MNNHTLFFPPREEFIFKFTAASAKSKPVVGLPKLAGGNAGTRDVADDWRS